jgi:DNA uptake protein ComE-like DNA-binding protein
MMRIAALFLVTLGLLATGARAQTRPPVPAAPAAAQVDINSASRDELMNLDGIGEVRADAIIRARPYKAKTELVERRLIPEALYDKLADKVTARPVPVAPPPRPAAPPAAAAAPPRR